ncbi:MAG TPA: circularly permuted type 2 ATP-grasp protein, partial [Rhodoferax sp.]|nr:circularly permuted type 2 ATP-grasp protein [Rhodoferax sp.]
MSEAFHLQPKETRPKPVSVAELAQAAQSNSGHYDELRGKAAGLTDVWRQFFSTLGNDTVTDMDQRSANLARQVRDNGITYNVYADENGPQRPWSLDLFPLIVDPISWQRIEAGVLQRMRLLERVMADVYGPQTLLHDGFLPPALVHAHPGYLRAMHGVEPVGGRFLHIAAFDLARGPDGNWWVEAQRSQAPSGLGYLLENRLAIAAQFPQGFQSLRV